MVGRPQRQRVRHHILFLLHVIGHLHDDIRDVILRSIREEVQDDRRLSASSRCCFWRVRKRRAGLRAGIAAVHARPDQAHILLVRVEDDDSLLTNAAHLWRDPRCQTDCPAKR